MIASLPLSSIFSAVLSEAAPAPAPPRYPDPPAALSHDVAARAGGPGSAPGLGHCPDG
jgi:hypothetical protein